MNAQVIKIVNEATGEVSTRDYKTVEMAQNTACLKLAKDPSVKLSVQIFTLNPDEKFAVSTVTKAEQYKAGVTANKEFRAAVKEEREVAKAEKANVRFLKAEAKAKVKAENLVARELDKEYRIAMKERKAVASAEKADRRYNDAKVKQQARIEAQVEKWEGYTDAAEKKTEKAA